MNRRAFVSGGLSAIIAGSQAPQHQPQSLLTSDRVRATFDADGTIHSMQVKNTGGWEPVEFCAGPFAGPGWADVQLESLAGSTRSFIATADGIRYSLRYQIEGDRLAIIAGLKNQRNSEYAPKPQAWC
jgi:hypothetical protein